MIPVAVNLQVLMGLTALASQISATNRIDPMEFARAAKAQGFDATAIWIGKNPQKFIQGAQAGFVLGFEDPFPWSESQVGKD